MNGLEAHGIPDADACRRFEHALLAHSSVAECAVLARTTEDGRKDLLAYVVPASTLAIEELRGRIQSLSPRSGVHLVQVSSIPRTSDGGVDAAALFRLPIEDAGLRERLERGTRSVPGIEHAAVMLDTSVKRVLPLHLSDLLSDWTVASSSPADAEQCLEQSRSGPAVKSEPTQGVQAHDSRRPSCVNGGPLELDPDSPVLLREVIERAACSSQRDLVYIESDRSTHVQSYRALLQSASRVLAGLQARGLNPSDRVILQLERHQDFIEVFWACVLGGFVPVPIAVPPTYEKSSVPLQTLQAAWNVLGAPAIVTARRSVDDLIRGAERAGLDGARVFAVEDLHIDREGQRHRGEPDDPALLMLTSGSTGTPKAVQLTHRNILTRTAASRQFNGFSESDVTLNWMPMDHVAGLIYFHIRDVYLGCRQIHVPTGDILQQPLKWIDYLDHYRVTTTFAPNFAFALVNDHADEVPLRSWDLSSVRLVLNGAEAIVAKTARRFLMLLAPYGLRPTCMRPAWGMSETSSGVIYSDTFSLDGTSDDDPFVEVGRPIPTLSIRIVDDADRVVDEGRIGRLQVQGPTITTGYFGAPQSTTEAFTSDGWFKTGDLGTIREGRLTITGREKDVVIINSVNYYSHAIEAVVEELDDVETSYTAACAVRPRGANTDRLAIFFHPLESDPHLLADLLGRIRAAVSTSIGIAPDYLLPVDAAAIPKTSLGKIQRSELSRRLVDGEFDEVLKLVDRLLANANTIPDWFFRKVWQRNEATPDPSLVDDGTIVLIFSDREGLGSEIRKRLEGYGAHCLTVHAGEAFAQLDRDTYRIDPRAESDHQRLLKTLASRGSSPTHIVHLWGYSRYDGEAIGDVIETAQFAGAVSAIWLANGLASDGGMAGDRWLTFVANHTQRVRGGEPVAYEKTPAIGLLKSLAHEMPSLRCRHVDVEPSDPGTVAALVVDELRIRQHDTEVAYRDGRRFVAALEKVSLRTDATREPLLTRNGTYLITGGMGGIGERVAEFLLDRFNANLLLVGRHALDARREEAFRRLQQRGGSVTYEAVNICDERRLIDATDRFRRRHGSLDGIIHLAGIYYERLVADETIDTFLAMLGPKTLGTDILHRVLTAQGGGFLLSSSSVAGFFGGASIGAYSAANRFQEAFADHFRDRGAVRHYCINWSNWNDIGQSCLYQRKESPRARGYRSLELVQALQSLLIALTCREPALIVGLEGTNRNIRRHLVEEPDTVGKPVIYYTTANGLREAQGLRVLDVRDDFGVPSTPDLVHVPRMPLTSTGEVDREQLARHGRAEGERTVVPPQTEAERRLVAIWRQVLGVPIVSCDDNFFDLGGDSLLAARLAAHVREAFGRELSLRIIFDAATLTELASVAGGTASALAVNA